MKKAHFGRLSAVIVATLLTSSALAQGTRNVDPPRGGDVDQSRPPAPSRAIDEPSRFQGGVRSPEFIRQVQETLEQKGYEPGEVDGIHGRKTQQALMEFQKDAGLAVTGRLNGHTIAALGLAEQPAAGGSGKR